MQQRFQPFTRLAAIILLVIGCLIVLRPFLAAILFAAAITISSWPLYQRLLARLVIIEDAFLPLGDGGLCFVVERH